MRKETRTLSLCLLGVILGSIAATENRYEKTTHVDKYTEYIGLGPHPLLDIKYLSGDKELFVKDFCNISLGSMQRPSHPYQPLR